MLFQERYPNIVKVLELSANYFIFQEIHIAYNVHTMTYTKVIHWQKQFQITIGYCVQDMTYCRLISRLRAEIIHGVTLLIS